MKNTRKVLLIEPNVATGSFLLSNIKKSLGEKYAFHLMEDIPSNDQFHGVSIIFISGTVLLRNTFMKQLVDKEKFLDINALLRGEEVSQIDTITVVAISSEPDILFDIENQELAHFCMNREHLYHEEQEFVFYNN